jgi:hypothetical protein
MKKAILILTALTSIQAIACANSNIKLTAGTLIKQRNAIQAADLIFGTTNKTSPPKQYSGHKATT